MLFLLPFIWLVFLRLDLGYKGPSLGIDPIIKMIIGKRQVKNLKLIAPWLVLKFKFAAELSCKFPLVEMQVNTTAVYCAFIFF